MREQDQHEACERHIQYLYDQLSKLLQIRQVVQETEEGLVVLQIVRLETSGDGMTVVVR